ncbi:related to L-ornithine N5-hydroxylase [Cephalotrichum gorgonifer]|uniref:L-ornithine N(5)-monooxygenase [NAD(P)H] n=1 Tax=Cephalotrichum gorgonifer TaxID=2041049 RepID=A0AAE8SY67_9PEZI|nr:related to L-ornithine N5-hydroxylase [Cephalotrichum gorgonifer]
MSPHRTDDLDSSAPQLNGASDLHTNGVANGIGQLKDETTNVHIEILSESQIVEELPVEATPAPTKAEETPLQTNGHVEPVQEAQISEELPTEAPSTQEQPALPEQANGHVESAQEEQTNGELPVEAAAKQEEPVLPQLTNGNGHIELPQEPQPNGQLPVDAPSPQESAPQASTAPQPPSHNPLWTPVKQSRFLLPSDTTDVHDVLFAGFGPASLSVAIAMHDKLSTGASLTPNAPSPRVLFLEKQSRFAWHAGMLLSGTTMQISFLKDLANLRNPRSEFTFLNYLHENGRLIDFINLDTFLPARVEYEDYLRWCAAHFDNLVQYNHEVVSVTPEPAADSAAGVKIFKVTCRNVKTGTVSSYRAKNVVLATGGQAKMPRELSFGHPRIIHSSQYAQAIPNLLTDRSRAYRVAVVGAGQSAAEIFSSVQKLYPNSQTQLIMRSEFLRPSDDSPFVNTIFNPSFIDHIHSKPLTHRTRFLTDAKATNYSVVRLQLIESIYEHMYSQRRDIGPDETRWPHRIRGGYGLVDATPNPSSDGVQLKIAPIEQREAGEGEETLDFDLVISATGYRRDAHLELLRDTYGLLPAVSAKKGAGMDGWEVSAEGQTRRLEARRNYGVKFAEGAVEAGSGVWLQGCNERTHGLSDTLLSVLAVRAGEMVESIFGA